MGSGYNPETKQYCSAHARELAEEENKNQRFQAECLQYRKQVEGLIAQLTAADTIKAQTAAQWAAHYSTNGSQSPQAHNTGYRSADLNSQLQGLSDDAFRF